MVRVRCADCSGQGLVEYVLGLTILLIVASGLVAVMGDWTRGGSTGGSLAAEPSHTLTVESGVGGVATWIVDVAAH